MIIVRVLGGLGNQMFQFALYNTFKQNGYNVKIDDSDIEWYIKKHNYMYAPSIFNIEFEKANDIEINKLSDKSMHILQKLKRKIFGRKSTHIIEKREGEYDDSIFKEENLYLDGNWQSEKYFINNTYEVQKMFIFPKVIDETCKKYEKLIKMYKNSVSLHIRRGDYLSKENNGLFGGICDDLYYERATKYIDNKVCDCHFFVFSNDKEYLKRFMGNDKYTIIDCGEESPSWYDMFLMSCCKHNIIANSTFSWWGAWLNCNKNKIVIAPKKWVNTMTFNDICPENWIRL